MKMNIVFMGTPAFAVPSLERLLEEGYNISLVVTQPDKPQGRKKGSDTASCQRSCAEARYSRVSAGKAS